MPSLRVVRVLCLTATTALLIAGPAEAQNPELGDTGQAPGSGATDVSLLDPAGTPAPDQPDYVPPPPAAAPAAGGVLGGTDHEQQVGTFGVGVFGLLALPLGDTGDLAGGTVTAPMIGARYWLSPRLGVEGALGLAITNDSTSIDPNPGMAAEPGASAFGLGLHGGVPLALAYSQHFVFEVVPELNLGFATGSRTTDGGAEFDRSGFLLELGGRAGAEIHFGFLDMPELSLQASVGLRIRVESRGIEDEDGNSQGTGRTEIATLAGNDPWEILVGNLAAIYYF